MKKRRPFLLLEMLIAIALLSSLIASLFGFFFYFSSLRLQLNREREERLHFLALEARLSYLLPRIREGDFLYTAEAPSGQWRGQSLVFVSDQGVSFAPEFSNGVLSRLYLDAQNQLCLVSWPYEYYAGKTEKDTSPHSEVLLRNVEKIQFSFFYPATEQNLEPHRNRADRDKFPDPEQGPYYTDWSIAYRKLPVFLRLSLFKEGQELTWVFFFPHSAKALTYQEE
ncbi:MAG: putative rane protein [Chlamydiales bacterium]|jgi:hypothetical protein|nr:putative rane protein [Chlamydiales bacterium]